MLRAATFASFNSTRPALLPFIDQNRVADSMQRFIFAHPRVICSALARVIRVFDLIRVSRPRLRSFGNEGDDRHFGSRFRHGQNGQSLDLRLDLGVRSTAELEIRRHQRRSSAEKHRDCERPAKKPTPAVLHFHVDLLERHHRARAQQRSFIIKMWLFDHRLQLCRVSACPKNS